MLPSWRMWSKLIDVMTLTTGRQTFVALLGVAGSRERVRGLHAQAMHALQPFGASAAPLRLLAQWLLDRRH